jgi:DtxR family Mn-dependent transcriptional regulator
MPTITVENYVKQIFLAHQAEPANLLPLGRLAEAMGVVPGTATSMVKALADADLADYEPRQGVRLTRKGERLALSVLRRHRLIESFLVRVLGLDWSEVHQEAEVLEHAVSDKVLERIDALLNRPLVDPHGDPIPARDGTMKEVRPSSLVDCEPNRRVTVSRIVNQEPAFLKFVEQSGLAPGAVVVVEGRNPAADSVAVRPHGRSAVTLGTAAAAKILVAPT